MEIELKRGDVVVDIVSKETGILLRRVNLFEHTTDPEYPALNAWEILWSGKVITPAAGRLQTYTEKGLINMITEGRFRLL